MGRREEERLMLFSDRTENCIHTGKDNSKQPGISEELRELPQTEICIKIKYMPSRTQQEEVKLL